MAERSVSGSVPDRFSEEIRNVPVTHQDHQVGTATVTQDGKIFIEFDNTLFAQVTYDFLTHGMADGLSIASNLIPAVEEKRPNG